MLQISFSKQEIIDLFWAWIAISFAFAFLWTRPNFFNFPQNLFISSLTVGLAFLVHEISHKIVAQNFGCLAEFRKFDLGLIFAILMSLFGFVFAAPGVVLIFGLVSERENGKIALAGPLSNIVLAALFLFLAKTQFKFSPIFYLGFSINSWLAFFNLLPFYPLDGSKVISWSFFVWAVFFGIAGFLTFFIS